MFDGSNDYVDLGLSNYNFNNTVSYVAYVKASLASKTFEFFGNWEGAGEGLGISSDNIPYFTVQDGSGWKYARGSAINSDQYYVMIGTYDGTNVKLYMDGVLVATTSASKLTTSAMSIFLGANPNASGTHSYYSNISLKEAMLYDGTLSQEQVTSLTNYINNKYSVKTKNMEIPTFTESGTTTKTIKITYPYECGSTYTCTYQKDNETEVTVTSKTASVSFTEDGSLVAKVSDGTNTASSSYNARMDRVLAIETVKGGSITLSKSTSSVGTNVTINKTATSGFTYQGATIVCQNGDITTTATSSFTVPNCTGTITIYPTWKKDDYIWFYQGKGSGYNSNNISLWSNTNYDVYKIPLQYESSYDYVRMDATTVTNSRNNYATNSTYDLTDYKSWAIRLDCYCNGDNCGSAYSTSQGVIRYWRNIITDNTSNWNTNNYSTTINETNKLDISDINGNRYLQLHLLVNNHKFWCGWVQNYLEGNTYSYYNKGV